jgi:uncharacterized coiled-coil DUF342 family protein
METLKSGLGHIPHVDIQELQGSISELESRLSALESSEQANDRASARAIAALLRNRRNIVEMLKRERFI